MSNELLIIDSLQVDNPFSAASLYDAKGNWVDTNAIMARLLKWERLFSAGSTKNTVSAVRSDWNQYVGWCVGENKPLLPSSIEQVIAYLEHCVALGKKRATLDRYVYTIGLIHTAAGLTNALLGPDWRLEFNVIVMKLTDVDGNIQKQALGLYADDINKIIATLGNSPVDLRDAALISLASDTLCRRSELVAVRWIDLGKDVIHSKMQLRVRRSKTNKDGKNVDTRWFSDKTYERLKAWHAIHDSNGYVFVATRGCSQAHVAGVDVPLQPKEVARIFRRRAEAAGIENFQHISGHSTRVGTAVDLIRDGASTTEVALAGKWKSDKMVLRYTGESDAGTLALMRLRGELPERK